jgi:phosphotransferase system enzyme I (PtsI)
MFTQILVGMGLDEFSVPAAAVPRIKQLIRGMTYESAQQFAREVLASQDPETLFRKQSPKRFEA